MRKREFLLKNERYLSFFSILLILIIIFSGIVVFQENENHYFAVLDINYSQDGSLVINAVYTSGNRNNIEIQIWDNNDNSLRTIATLHKCDMQPAYDLLGGELIIEGNCVYWYSNYGRWDDTYDRNFDVSISPDNQYAVIQSFTRDLASNFLQIWNIEEKTLVTNLWWWDVNRNPQKLIWVNGISQFATSKGEDIVKWENGSKNFVNLIENQQFYSHYVNFNSDGSQLLYIKYSGNKTYEFEILDLQTNSSKKKFFVQDYLSFISLVDWSLDGSKVMATHFRNLDHYDEITIYLWNIQTNILEKLPVGNLSYLKDWSPNFKYLLLSDLNNNVTAYGVWNTQTENFSYNITKETWNSLGQSFHYRNPVALSPNGKELASRGRNGIFFTVDLTTNTITHEYKPYELDKYLGISISAFGVISLITMIVMRKKLLQKIKP